jgi:ketosteroid isomerase-like protein
MNDIHAINVAKTEFRDGYNAGHVERVASVFAESVTDFSDGFPSFFDAEGKAVLRKRLERLFEKCHTRVVVTIIDIMVVGETAIEYGWHEFTFTPKTVGRPRTFRERYVEMWRKQSDGAWKIVLYINNADHEPQMPDADEAVESGVVRQMFGSP